MLHVVNVSTFFPVCFRMPQKCVVDRCSIQEALLHTPFPSCDRPNLKQLKINMQLSELLTLMLIVDKQCTAAGRGLGLDSLSLEAR